MYKICEFYSNFEIYITNTFVFIDRSFLMVLKQNFYVIKLKRNFFGMIFLCFAFGLLLFSNDNLPAVKTGLSLWAGSVVPSLFPFFVATELLMHTNIVTLFGIVLNRFMKPFFNIRGEGAFCFIMGLISGYPVGAKIACNFRKNNICSKAECERLLSFTNNSGPLFIIGTVGISMFGNTTIGILLLVTHILACLTVGFIFRFWKYHCSDKINATSISSQKTEANFVSVSNLGGIMAESITSSISTILLIGGFIVLFSSIISILKASGILPSISILLSPVFEMLHIDIHFITPFLTGFLEITNGISLLSKVLVKNISVNLIFTAFLLGFGGISVLLQVFSIIAKSDLSIKPYVYGKLLQGVLAAIYTFLAISIFPFLNFNIG